MVCLRHIGHVYFYMSNTLLGTFDDVDVFERDPLVSLEVN
jgi:hypothetical protein